MNNESYRSLTIRLKPELFDKVAKGADVENRSYSNFKDSGVLTIPGNVPNKILPSFR